VHTCEVRSWYDPIPRQALGGIAADDRYLYLITTGRASGLAMKSEPFHFVVWDPVSGIRWKKQLDQGLELTCLAPLNGDILVAVGKDILIFDPAKMAFTGAVSMDDACTCMLPFGEDTLAAFCGDTLVLVDPAANRATPLCDLPGIVRSATVTPAGDLYFAQGAHLYNLPAGD